MCPNSGHLRITVTPDQATVDYVRSGGTGGCTPSSFTSRTRLTPMSPPDACSDYGRKPDRWWDDQPGRRHPYLQRRLVVSSRRLPLRVCLRPLERRLLWLWRLLGDDGRRQDRHSQLHGGHLQPDDGGRVRPVGARPIRWRASIPTPMGPRCRRHGPSPAMGYTFSSLWSGACSGSGARRSVTMDAAKTVTANFTVINYI